MNFIKKIFDGRIDESVQRQFRKFGRGVYERRAVMDVSVGKELKIKTTYEFANEFVRFLAGTIKNKAHVSGGVITSKDVRSAGIFEIKDVKQFAGVKTYLIDSELTKEQILKALDLFPDAVFCLSFSTEYGSLVTKVKSPKSMAKATKGGDKIKADYCTFVTPHKEFKKEFELALAKVTEEMVNRLELVIAEEIVSKSKFTENDADELSEKIKSPMNKR